MADHPNKTPRAVIDLVLDGVSRGLTLKLACQRARIVPETFHAHCRKDATLQIEYEAVAAECALRWIDEIRLGTKGSSGTAQLLFRRFYQDFPNNNNTNHVIEMKPNDAQVTKRRGIGDSIRQDTKAISQSLRALPEELDS